MKDAFTITAITFDSNAFDLEGFVDELFERIGIGDIRKTNRKSSSSRSSRENRATGKFCCRAEFFFDAKNLIVFCDTVSSGG